MKRNAREGTKGLSPVPKLAGGEPKLQISPSLYRRSVKIPANNTVPIFFRNLDAAAYTEHSAE